MENKKNSLVLTPNEISKKIKVYNDQQKSCHNDDTHLNNKVATTFQCNKQSDTTNLETGENKSPIKLFPEELWELILHQLHNSQDIQNVFLAFPELDRVFHNKKALWLIDLVLPHMTKHLIIKTYNRTNNYKHVKSQELLNLRLVSKRWKNAVENLLISHPDNHPPLSKVSCDNSDDENKSGKLIQPILFSTHLNYTRLEGFNFGATKFRTGDQIDRFLEQMGGYSGNPFVRKSVFIKPFNEGATTSHDMIEKCVDLFEKFGEHVQILEMHFWDTDSEYHFTMCKNILKCLTYLPNLRSLTFQGELDTYSYVFTNYYFDDRKTQKYFPRLPNLESFSWKVRFTYQFESSWITRMMKTYGNISSLRKLEFAENNWNKIDRVLEQSFSELHLLLDLDHDTSLEDFDYSFGGLLRNKALKKFILSQIPPPLEGQPNFQRHEINITELLFYLGNYQIENLILENLRLIEEPIEEDMKFVSSVTSLYLEDNSKLSYEFLRWLPNLKSLTIFIKHDPHFRDLYAPREGTEVCTSAEETKNWLAKNLRKNCLKAYDKDSEIPKDFSIWKAFPKLEVLRSLVVIVGSESGQESVFLEVKFFREYGNKAFYSNRPDGYDDDDDESEEDQI